MPEIWHAEPAASAVVDQYNVQLPAFSRSGEMGRILSERGPFRTSSQQTQKHPHVFHSWNQLFNTDARNLERRHGSANIGISFILADHERSGFGNREITAGHAGPRRQKPGTSVVSHGFRQKERVVIAWFGAYCASEYL